MPLTIVFAIVFPYTFGKAAIVEHCGISILKDVVENDMQAWRRKNIQLSRLVSLVKCLTAPLFPPPSFILTYFNEIQRQGFKKTKHKIKQMYWFWPQPQYSQSKRTFFFTGTNEKDKLEHAYPINNYPSNKHHNITKPVISDECCIIRTILILLFCSCFHGSTHIPMAGYESGIMDIVFHLIHYIHCSASFTWPSPPSTVDTSHNNFFQTVISPVLWPYLSSAIHT